MSTEQPVTQPPFPFIPVDGGCFDQNALLLRAEMRMLMEIQDRVRLRENPRSFVILSGVGL